MAFKGKNTCRILKQIRRQIAEANDIDLVIRECTYQGDCLGTCPHCEAEVAYLEKELARRQALGKAVCISGIAASALLATPAAAHNTTPAAPDTTPQQCSTTPATADTTAQQSDELMGVIVEQMPEFPGGQAALFRFLSDSIRYPEGAWKDGKEGRCVCMFTVCKDGKICDIEVVRSAGDERLDAEAVRVLSLMPDWTPGEQRGKPINVKYAVPCRFSIPKENVLSQVEKMLSGDTVDTEQPYAHCTFTVDGSRVSLWELDKEPTLRLVRHYSYETAHQIYSAVASEGLVAIETADTIHVRGRVLAEDGTPLEGVRIQEVGSSLLTLSDKDGLFSLTTAQDARLVVVLFGFVPQEIAAEPIVVCRLEGPRSANDAK